MVAPAVFFAGGIVFTLAALVAVGETQRRRRAAALSAVLDIPGLAEGVAAWQANEVSRAVVFSAPMLIEVYADCMATASEIQESIVDVKSDDQVTGGWISSIGVLSAWHSYRSSVAAVLISAEIGPLIQVIDAIVIGSTQDSLADAAKLAGVEGVIDPMERIEPFLEMIYEADMAKHEDDEGED